MLEDIVSENDHRMLSFNLYFNTYMKYQIKWIRYETEKEKYINMINEYFIELWKDIFEFTVHWENTVWINKKIKIITNKTSIFSIFIVIKVFQRNYDKMKMLFT
jgi:hypothetical protein